ncbi:hypothetical protein ABR737_09570 [Streptomyces sp. Edi2]|uniref:hypothetical protein n=1 Tax=Streptomyces sp. Edi2 TaxID=3162528 RepID=UPI00330602F1
MPWSLATKQQIDPAPQGPIKELRAGWDIAVEFGPAAQIILATARGAVLTWRSLPEPERDPAFRKGPRWPGRTYVIPRT